MDSKCLLFFLVIVTSLMTQGSAQYFPSTNLQVSASGVTQFIIRFHGDSYVRYDLNVMTYEMLVPSSNESLSFQFITQDREGLIWIFQGRDGRTMHVSIRGGSLLFVNKPANGPAQQVVLRHPDSRSLSDYTWHTLRIDKDGQVLRFYIDNKYAGTMTTSNVVQFLSRGQVYLGGSPQTSIHTGGVVDTNFDGAVTDVVYSKVSGPSQQLIVSFLQSVSQFNRTGDLDIFDYNDVIDGTVIWDRTTPAPPTPKPYAPTPITFMTGTSTLRVEQTTDLRNGGEISFRFRTLEPRGLLMLANRYTDYVALEVFDGKLYFVYNLGSAFSRKELTDANIDDGEWHDFAMRVDGNQLFLTLDGRTILPALRSTDRLYFTEINIGGSGQLSRFPWALYSRQGYKGCIEALKIKGIGMDLHKWISSAEGVEIGCRSMPTGCQNQPCVSGYCKDRMGGYQCICYNTRFTGRNCDIPAYIGSWDGTTSTNYEFINREVTHTNDISVRFMTPLRDTLLFITENDRNDDFILAELVDGRVKVTMKAGEKEKSFLVGENLNGYNWHNLNIMRRANNVRIQVDDQPVLSGFLEGENYELTIDRIILGNSGNGQQSPNSYIGYLQNFFYGRLDMFAELKKLNSNVKWITSPEGIVPPIIFKPITVTTSDAFFQLRSLNIGLTMNLMFSFKTREPNGLLLYNGGIGNDVIAIELTNGMLRVAYNLGDRNMFTIVPSPKPLNDNQWHNVFISLNDKGLLHARVDNSPIDVSASSGDKKLSLTGNLYVAGLPEDMFQRREIKNLIESRSGFRGCLASVDLNGAVPDLMAHTKDRQFVLNGCTDVNMTCKPNACGTGTCMPSVSDYWCDCNMTGYVGIPCATYPTGYYFGKNGRDGIIIYQFPFESQADSNNDMIAFGFMTREENGVLFRVESGVGDDFIEIKLENGFVVASSNTGTKTIVLTENAQKFNDGQYHVVRYFRDSMKSSLQIDSLPIQAVAHGGTVSVFDKVYRILIGGRMDAKGVQSNNFYGIMGGAYYNGNRWFDILNKGVTLIGKKVDITGDVVFDNAYILVERPLPTPAPTPIYIPPVEEIPDGIGGGGLVGPGISGGGGGGGGGIIGIGGPGGLTGVFGGVPVNVAGTPVTGPLMLAGPAPPPMATGARAGAVVGTVLGTMAFMTSLMWALYKLKPGVPTCLSPGAGAAGGGAGGGSGIVISPPRPASNLAAVQAVSGGGGGGGAGAGGSASKVTVVNGSAAGGAGAGGGSSTYTSYFQSTSTSVQGGGAGGGGAAADSVDSANLRATGRAHLGSSSTNYSANYQTNTMQSYGSGGGTLSNYDRQYMAGNDNIPDYDMPMSGTMQSGHSYSSSTLNTHYNYQVQNLKTVTINRQGQYVMSGTSGGAVTPGAASDEVRVDCCLITGDRCHVVTGSSLGPPQVWDMQTGELQNIMKGDTVGSTDLHLVCGDRLLVGAVHADMEINEYSSRKGVFNHSLQIWDFQTGKPLSMAEGEYCSALCPMSDNDKVLFGRTDKFGDATSIIAWDLMGNQMIKEMRYDTPVGNNDYISYLNLSKNDRYVVAGFVNSFDNCAEFIVFDMTLTSYNIGEPAILKLDANPEVTAILPKDEAVTGLRNGDLVIWSIRTGQPSRQLLGSGGAHAHTREVKTVTLSEDGKYLVSGSADGTLKVWDMHTERPIHTLAGHADEVWCSAISPDNEIVVSGSNDGTIRLWRMKNGSEMCVFNCGVDIFFVTMSHDKGTIVALGDKYGARKLIMLQVVRTKIKKIVSS